MIAMATVVIISDTNNDVVISLINGAINCFLLQLDRMKDVQVWKDAATQMFFTLSLGFGALIAFASYMPYKNQCVNDAYTVVLINCGTSIFAGIVVFSILGYRELKTNIPATSVSILASIQLIIDYICSFETFM